MRYDPYALKKRLYRERKKMERYVLLQKLLEIISEKIAS